MKTKLNQRKKETYRWFGEGCKSCFKNTSCISASRSAYDFRKYLLRILGYREPRNKYMKRGTKVHEEYFAETKTVDEYGVKNFLQDLYAGKEILLKEFTVCSKTYGIQGHIDCIKIQFKDRKYKIEIIELKPTYRRNYIRQVGIYALILSDPYCQFWYRKKMKKEHLISRNLYLPETNVDINVKFIFYKTNKEFHMIWGENNGFVRNLTTGIKSRLKQLRELHKAREIKLYSLKYCRDCPMIKNNGWNCNFIPICKKYPYVKESQKRFGKKKILIK